MDSLDTARPVGVIRDNLVRADSGLKVAVRTEEEEANERVKLVPFSSPPLSPRLHWAKEQSSALPDRARNLESHQRRAFGSTYSEEPSEGEV